MDITFQNCKYFILLFTVSNFLLLVVNLAKSFGVHSKGFSGSAQLTTGTLRANVWYVRRNTTCDSMATDAAETRKSMRTRSVNTEILFNLSSSRNITESLKTFGATERDTDILLCSIDKVKRPALYNRDVDQHLFTH